MLIEILREVTLPRYTLKNGELVTYNGNLQRQYNDRFNHWITLGGGKVMRSDFHIHACNCDYIKMLSGAASAHGVFYINVCRICRRQKMNNVEAVC